MNRIAILLCLVLLLAFGATALAQQPLPAPSAGESQPKSGPSIAISAPLAYGDISASELMIWEDIGAQSYKITWKLAATGEVITWKPPFDCFDGKCMNYAYPMPLFDAANDGDSVLWRVTAKVGGVKHKSAWNNALVDETDNVALLAPQDNAALKRENISLFTWDGVQNSVKNILYVKDAATGETVIKHSIDFSADCNFTFGYCAASLMDIGDPVDLFQTNAEYKWYTITKGVSGEKAKSQVFRFTTTAD